MWPSAGCDLLKLDLTYFWKFNLIYFRASSGQKRQTVRPQVTFDKWSQAAQLDCGWPRPVATDKRPCSAGLQGSWAFARLCVCLDVTPWWGRLPPRGGGVPQRAGHRTHSAVRPDSACHCCGFSHEYSCACFLSLNDVGLFVHKERVFGPFAFLNVSIVWDFFFF